MRPGDRHFGCTRCGACCVRSPEVELSEAAALADTFVFRLLVRLHPGNGNERLKQFAAARVPGSPPAYLTLSALTVDAGEGRCAALQGRLCAIHERRPLSCQSVPLHYSRSNGGLIEAFDRFVTVPEHDCDTSPDAPMLLSDGEAVDPAIADARRDAIVCAQADREWKKAIVDRMKDGRDAGLPTIDEVRAHAATGALTTSMRVAWQIAAERRWMTSDRLAEIITKQVSVIDRMLDGKLSSVSRQTLGEMRAEYALALRTDRAT